MITDVKNPHGLLEILVKFLNPIDSHLNPQWLPAKSHRFINIDRFPKFFLGTPKARYLGYPVVGWISMITEVKIPHGLLQIFGYVESDRFPLAMYH